jgi:hypothetical protein
MTTEKRKMGKQKMMNRFRFIAGQIAAPLTAYFVAALINSHEKAWGMYCAPSVCGPDDLPGTIFLSVWVGLAMVAYRITKN